MKGMLVENEFNIGEFVYVKADKDQLVRQVTSLNVNAVGHKYWISSGSTETCHFEFELSKEKTLY